MSIIPLPDERQLSPSAHPPFTGQGISEHEAFTLLAFSLQRGMR